MLKIHKVSKALSNVRILDEVSLDVKKASIFGLAGPSGSGKSTLLRCIQKLETPDSGSIDYSCRVCFMFQDFQLFPHMTVLQNLVYAPTLKDKANAKEHIDKAKMMLKNLGIESKINDYPRTLSGGQKQRVALARSLMINPDVLLCDEPTSGLDVSTIMDVVSLLKSVNNIGVTIVIASHDLDFLTKISDRIVLLKNGKIAIDIIPSQTPNSVETLKGFY
jgi:polar amino acid transport system ATP-binding protein